MHIAENTSLVYLTESATIRTLFTGSSAFLYLHQVTRKLERSESKVSSAKEVHILHVALVLFALNMQQEKIAYFPVKKEWNALKVEWIINSV